MFVIRWKKCGKNKLFVGKNVEKNYFSFEKVLKNICYSIDSESLNTIAREFLKHLT